MSNYIPISGTTQSSVILVSGTLGVFDTSYNNLHYNKYISELKITDRTGGRMKLTVVSKDEKRVVVTGCLVEQAESFRIKNDTVSILERNVGAHWFSVNLSSDDVITIHETHPEDKDNDTWDSTVLDRDNILSLSIIVFGYLTTEPPE